MKYCKKLSLILSVMLVSMSLMACAKTTEMKTDTVESVKQMETTAETTEQTGALEKSVTYPVTVKDSEGSEVMIETEPEKVISLAPNITEMIFVLGAGDKLVGRTDYCDYPKEALEITSIGTLQEPDIEKIVSLEPDLVIASTHFSEESEKQLSDLGIKVLVLYEEHEIDGVYTMLETLGTVINAQEKSLKAVNDMKAVMDETKEVVSGLEAPSVYYVVGFGEYGDYTAGGDTFISQLITLAGGENIAKEVQGWSYSLESLVAADPDIILIDNTMKDAFISADHYKDLSAVKNGMVFGIDKSILERQGVRNAEGVRTIAEIFHADAF